MTRSPAFASIKSSSLGKNSLLLMLDWRYKERYSEVKYFYCDFTLNSEIKALEAEKLIYDNTVSEGMMPKIRTCIKALDDGVKGVVIIDGRKPHSILFELFSDQGAGTLIRK